MSRGAFISLVDFAGGKFTLQVAFVFDFYFYFFALSLTFGCLGFTPIVEANWLGRWMKAEEKIAVA